MAIYFDRLVSSLNTLLLNLGVGILLLRSFVRLSFLLWDRVELRVVDEVEGVERLEVWPLMTSFLELGGYVLIVGTVDLELSAKASANGLT